MSTKHPLAIKWDEWRESEQGRVALGCDILRNNTLITYLENRLYHAFMAGVKAQKEIKL